LLLTRGFHTARFRNRYDEAGLPQCSAHGLRKGAARGNQHIKSRTGHTTNSEVARYTAAASQRSLSDDAAEKLMANLRERLAKSTAQDTEKQA